MKQTLIILLAFGWMNCWGQYEDTAHSKWLTPGNGITSFTISPKTDTIKVLMLVCDTSYIGGSMIYFRHDGALDLSRTNSVWWQYGYEVLEKRNSLVGSVDAGIWSSDWDKFNYWVVVNYLDQNKKPLPKSIVVWMTKEIKN